MPAPEICFNDGPQWRCSLPKGHSGNHKAYKFHNLSGEFLESWAPESPEVVSSKTKRQLQRDVVEDMLASLRTTMLENLPKCPEDWNGIELRQLLADTARDRFVRPGLLKGKRLKNYKNERLVRNL